MGGLIRLGLDRRSGPVWWALSSGHPASAGSSLPRGRFVSRLFKYRYVSK